MGFFQVLKIVSDCSADTFSVTSPFSSCDGLCTRLQMLFHSLLKAFLCKKRFHVFHFRQWLLLCLRFADLSLPVLNLPRVHPGVLPQMGELLYLEIPQGHFVLSRPTSVWTCVCGCGDFYSFPADSAVGLGSGSAAAEGLISFGARTRPLRVTAPGGMPA